MIIQDALREICKRIENGNCGRYVIHEAQNDVYFTVNCGNIIPREPYYSELEVDMLLSDAWEYMTEDEFLKNHLEHCKEVQREYNRNHPYFPLPIKIDD